MAIATPETYADMIDRAKAGKYAIPAINVTSSQTLSAALQGFADAESDGIIQVSNGGAAYWSGSSRADRVKGSLALSAYAYAVADLVLCRSGAGTVAELAALGIPGYFVPLPIGNGEQEKNAAEAVRAGGARLVRDRDFSLKNVTDEIIPLVLDGDRLAAMSTALSELMPVDADKRLARLIEETGERR